jgi:hypothetical protein
VRLSQFKNNVCKQISSKSHIVNMIILVVIHAVRTYKGVSKSFWTGCLEWELQMVQLSATRCNCIAILWVSLVSFVAITLCVASQWVFIVVNLETFGYILVHWTNWQRYHAKIFYIAEIMLEKNNTRKGFYFICCVFAVTKSCGCAFTVSDQSSWFPLSMSMASQLLLW